MNKIFLTFLCGFLIISNVSITQELLPEQVFESANKSVVVVLSYDENERQVGFGSGVVFGESGYIATNLHVLGEGVRLKISNYQKTITDIKVIGYDLDKDILVLKIPENIGSPLKVADITEIKTGQRIYCVGSNLGVENSISEGVISSLKYPISKETDYIQISAPVSMGNSGGAVLNSSGELIGISTIGNVDGQKLNFAIRVTDFIYLNNAELTEREMQCLYLHNKGKTCYQENKFNDAFKYYTRYLQLKNDNKFVYIERANVFYKLSDPQKAINDLNAAIKLDPFLKDAYYQRAIFHEKIGNYKEAILDLTRVLELTPKDSVIYFYRGQLLIKDRKSNEAILDFSKYLEFDPNNAFAYNYQGVAYSKLKKYEEAVTCFTKAIEINDKYDEAYYNRGDIYLIIKQFNKCINDNSKAIEINPKFANAFLNRGNAYYQSNKADKGCEDLLKARALGSTDADRLLKAYCE